MRSPPNFHAVMASTLMSRSFYRGAPLLQQVLDRDGAFGAGRDDDQQHRQSRGTAPAPADHARRKNAAISTAAVAIALTLRLASTSRAMVGPADDTAAGTRK